MKLILLFLALLAACSGKPRFNLASSNQLIEYQIRNDQYVIIVVEEQNLSAAQARQMAHNRAAELTIENGSRYYTVESDEDVQVSKTNGTWPSEPGFHQNLYQELIMEKDMDRQSAQRQPTTQTVPAVRLIIQCYAEKPNKKSFDASK